MQDKLKQLQLPEIEITNSYEDSSDLFSYLQIIKEQERAKIAKEIQNDIGKILTEIKKELLSWDKDIGNKTNAYIEKIELIEALVDQVIGSAKRISMDLRPDVLDSGVVAAIKWQAKKFCEQANLKYRFSCDNDEILMHPDLSIAIFRMFQEILTNISSHANATRIQIRLSEKEGWVNLEITDNGMGMSDQDTKKPKSYGIRGMRERCQQLEGYLLITTKSGKWTKISISIPIKSLEKASINSS
ncbi:MAG: hypothetical protein CMH70_01410 [Nitrosomonadaceae bacterium]|nr:hypothetical protein [Nitrosomonadaceae bacterium]|tara:strand:+ start:380 stop:1111 length:732 start_codon:yes stop_codon:yes gene_type:complete